MNSLYDILADAEDGEAMAMLGREFGLTPQQTQAAVMALLPAISTGLKQATATPEGLGSLFGVMGHQRDLHAMYGAPDVAFAAEGRAAGNDVLSVIFGSPDVSRAVVDQAQQFSGVGGAILKKMLPVIAGIIISGLMGGRGQGAPKGSATAPSGNVLGDILGQIFGRGLPGGVPPQAPAPQFPAPSPGGQTHADPDRSQPGRRSRPDPSRTREGLARGTDQAGDRRWRADYVARRSRRPVSISHAGRTA